MNWIMLPVIAALLFVVYTLNEKSKRYLLMKIVQRTILNKIPYSENFIIQAFNLAYSFIIVPILLMAIALLLGTTYIYSFTFSVVVYVSTFMLL